MQTAQRHTMTSANEIGQVMRQTQRYWYEDGLSDMGFGVWILGVGLLLAAQALTPPGSPLWLVWGVGGPLLLIGGGVVVNKVVRTLKERITYPRTGYVSYERARGTSRIVRRLATFLVAAGVAAGIIVLQKNWLSLTVIFGFVYLAAFTFVGLRFGLRRYLVLALWSLLLGLALASLSLKIEQAGALFQLGAGAAWLLAGWLTYRQYIASAPQPEEAGDGTSS
jgi:hypothetical protein